ncbi:helix-turn-helix domain-containing protein [Burkholderia pseudomallei]|uniref:helix-turn-helix domain-containing protein n=1 Tax=Burkholderia pseudomallei TaxID=28450 RepID=UPI0005376010|nr:helix-turn-helix domain-containing protein [Burkholderia pseudomallei]KGX75050.1 bacterial regulatory s, luxR family protein [Burkholderia pseudomallei MSHR435]
MTTSKALSEKQEALALSRLAQGQSVAAIAREMSTSRQTIMRLRARGDVISVS